MKTKFVALFCALVLLVSVMVPVLAHAYSRI